MRKSQVEYLLAQLPENFALEDLVERLVVVEKINEAQRSLDENGGIPHEQVVTQMREYMKKRRDEQHRVVA